MKLLRIMCVMALALCLTTSVYAGTQSVKISGDLTIRSLIRGDYDLSKNDAEALGTAGSPRTGAASNWAKYFMSTTEVQLDADLTDNVSAVIRLFNQRDWDVTAKSLTYATNLTSLGDAGYTSDGDEFDIGVDIAYIELKEFLYSPLTIRVGRQDIWFGKGFIVGANLQDYNANITADEYTAMQSFDAIRATLDYDPWTIDAIAAKIEENAVDSDDDEDLFGVNVGYIFDSYNAEAEAYWFNKRDHSLENWHIKDDNIVHTLGLRGSADPIENWTVAAEGAYQFGEFVGFRHQQNSRDRSAWAIDVSAECRHFKNEYEWKPVVGAEYIFYSGDRQSEPTVSTAATYEGWDPMYRGKFDTAYREFVGKYNLTAMGNAGRNVDYVNNYPDASYHNQHQVIIYGGIQPTDSLAVDARYAFFWLHRDVSYPHSVIEPASPENGTMWDERNKFMGQEIDVTLTWDYTEDVQFGLLCAWFFPGSHYNDQSDDPAQDYVGSVKLSF